MKVIILAGGFGTRLSEYTNLIPKPMVQIGDKPILWHIMDRYAHYGHNDFYVALGYKAEVIKRYFLDQDLLSSDFTIDLKTGKKTYFSNYKVDWKVSLINTGLNSMTGGRLKRLKDFIGNDTFMLTYGDGLADINIKSLLTFHKQHKKMVTVTAVRPSARFGELKINESLVTSFQEKPQTDSGWINGGYFVIEPKFLDLIEDDSTILEKEPLEKVCSMGEFAAYQHDGFWQCMDTKRDHDMLNSLYKEGGAPWNIFNLDI